MVLLVVVLCVGSAGALFVSGSIEIAMALRTFAFPTATDVPSALLLTEIIGAIDSYLIAMVLVIFSFGVYELFIGKIECARTSPTYHSLLEIDTLDDLKNKVLKVIIMVLIVWFFQMVLDEKLAPGSDMLLGAASIAALCIGIYFLHKNPDQAAP